MIEEQPRLLVIDDVWTVAAAAAFRAAGASGRLLYAAREPAFLHGVGAEIKRIDVLPAEATRELLRALTGRRVLPSEADPVLEATGRVALAVALVGAAIGRGPRTWRQTVDQLGTGTEAFLEHPYADIFKAMQVPIAALTGDPQPWAEGPKRTSSTTGGCGWSR